MFRVYELDSYISSFQNNYSLFNISTSSNGNFKIGNVDTYGLEISIAKGSFTLDNVFYSRPYPTADFYNVSTPKTFNYKLNYKFNPLIYYSNGYLFYHLIDGGNGAFDTALFSNGFSYQYNNIDYLIDGFRISVNNNIDGAGTQNSFILNTSGGSYYNDPNEDNYLNVNYSTSNYSNSYYSFSDINSKFSSYKTYSGLVSESTYSTGNFNNSLGYYFRDFINNGYNIYLGFYNNPFLNKVSVANDNSFDGLQRKDLTNIPNLSSFLGNLDSLVSQPLLLTQSDNNFHLTNSFYSIGSSDLSFFTRYISKSDIREIINDFGFDGTFNSIIETNWIIDFNGEVSEITSSTTPTINDGYGMYDFIDYSLSMPRENKVFDPLNFEDLTFSNSLYLDNFGNISIYASGYNLESLPVINFNENSFLSSVFNGTMGVGFGAITIGGLAASVFLFRGLIALFRSNK